jgi:hypothetical protein
MKFTREEGSEEQRHPNIFNYHRSHDRSAQAKGKCLLREVFARLQPHAAGFGVVFMGAHRRAVVLFFSVIRRELLGVRAYECFNSVRFRWYLRQISIWLQCNDFY